MKLKDILTPSFAALRKELGLTEERRPMVEACRADDSDFCREVVAKGWLTAEQMARAAERYRLGKSKKGRCIFWMIDEQGRVRDGHIGQEWASQMLKRREPRLLSDWHAAHCLFGLHTLQARSPVCIVEKETSAVILSELFPDSVWLATVYPMNFNIFSFEPLRGHSVTLFPHTDETMDTYLAWLELANQAQRRYRMNITVSDILERHATPAQKAAQIDLVDFLFPSH